MLYILHGDDELTRSEQLARWKEKVGDPTTASLNTVTVDGRKLSVRALVEACDTLPFMGSRRMVVAEGFWSRFEPPRGGRGRGQKRSMTADDQALVEGVVEYLARIPATTRLVFVEDRALSRGNPAFRLLPKDPDQLYVKEFRPPAERQLSNWIERRIKAKDGDITPEAARELGSLVGADLRQLDQELEKLLAHANFCRPICVEDIQALVSAKQLSGVFELVDAIGMRQADTAMRALHELLDAGAAPLYLLHMIERQFRILLQVKDMHSRGAGLSEIQSELGIRHTFIVKKALNQARRFSPQRLEAIFVHLAGIEQEIKTGRVADLLALDLLVAEVSLGDA